MDSARLSELYSSLEGKSPRDQLSIYSEISSLLVSIAKRKLVDVSGKRIFDLAEKVTSTFDIYSAKELFPSCIIKGNDVYLGASLFGSRTCDVPSPESILFSGDKEIVERYRKAVLRFHLFIGL
ncbi:MAG TPA: hypothetical protein PKC96_05505 [Bacilli bacterium]|nr:hypothetical protein [Bacilli bacterium]